MFEYNGINTSDLLKVPADEFYPTYDLANFTWESLRGKMNETTLTATFQGVSSSPHRAFGNGSISFQVNSRTAEGATRGLGQHGAKQVAKNSAPPLRERGRFDFA